MSIAEELLIIAENKNKEKEIQKLKEKNEKDKILKNNTFSYWNDYVLPLFRKRAEDGIYFINFKFAQKKNHYSFSGDYYPVEPIDEVYGHILIFDDIFGDSDKTHIFQKYWKLPISINYFIALVKSNGFYIKNETDYSISEVYDLEISCKPYPQTFRESLILADQEHGYHNSGYSKGEQAIELLLITNNIPYKRQFTFSNCKYQKELPFDFVIFNANHEIIYAIEYDGEQHFKFIQHWHKTEEGFKQQQLRDSIKTDFCKINNIKLIRIPYTEYNNIEQILKDNHII